MVHLLLCRFNVMECLTETIKSNKLNPLFALFAGIGITLLMYIVLPKTAKSDKFQRVSFFFIVIRKPFEP